MTSPPVWVKFSGELAEQLLAEWSAPVRIRLIWARDHYEVETKAVQQP